MQRSVKIALAAVVVVIVAGAAGFWYFVLRDTSDPVASLEALQEEPTDATATATNPDGTWTVVAGENVFAGYRIQELFGGETIKKTATGRTPAVTGTISVQGDQITAVDITADLTKLQSSESRRDGSQRDGGLQTNTFPTAARVW